LAYNNPPSYVESACIGELQAPGNVEEDHMHVLTGTAHSQITILPATQGIALAFLGPGSLSIDACLFGRKRLDIRVPAC
jgi:hypothetical protein